ncbi:MAG: response regulator [Vicinamibacteria bacterium]|nr:response regulator [Vicinamibacteria bacterium]
MIRAALGACLLALSLVSPAWAIDWPTAGRLPLRVFTDRDGLPQNAITAIAFDRDGALWIGTKDGAARYNGRIWTSVSMPKGCASNWIQAILQTRDGSLWFATRGGGVARLLEGAWSVYTRAEGLPSAEVLALIESVTFRKEPVVLAGTDQGLAWFDGSRFIPVPLPEGSPTLRVTSFFEGGTTPDVAGLWLGLRDGILRLTNGVWTVFDLAESEVPRNNPVRAFALTTAFDGRETLVAAPTHPGLLQFREGRWLRRPLEGLWIGMLQALLTTRDRDGADTLWVAGQARLARIHKGRVDSFGAESGFPAQGFWSLAETPPSGGEPALWAGMAGGGLVRLQREGWTTFDAPNWLKESSVYGLLETREPDGSQVIWVGTNRGGLVRLSDRTRTVYSGKDKAGSDTVLSLLETTSKSGRRTLWAGTTGGLGMLRDGRWSLFPLSDGLVGATVNASIASMNAEGEPVVWLGTGDGLGRIEGDRVRNMTKEIGLVDPRVNALLETHDAERNATLWVATERGLARHAGGITTTFTTKEGLPADAVISLAEIREAGRRSLWIGTRLGVTRVSLDEPAAALSAPPIPVLPNNTIYQIRQDLQGRVYLFTNKGIARLTPRAPTTDDPSPYEMYVFTTADGLPSAECNTGASMVDSQGRVWVGTIQGAAVVEPQASRPARPRPLRIERAVNARTYAPLTEGASLAHDQGQLTFEFALLNLFRDEDTRYRTQLVGLDAEPSAWTADAKKEYTSLPEGRYVFTVWGRDVSGAVSGPVRRGFTVRAAPWRTWWAYFAYAMVLALLLRAAFRWRLRSIRRRNLELEEVISARTRELGEAVLQLKESEQTALQAKDAALQASRAKSTFLANMSHELRTPLNAVIGFAQVLERRESLKGEDRESLRIIHRSGEHLLSLINDVLSLSKIEAGALALVRRPFDLPALLEAVREIIRARAEGKGLELRFEVDRELPRVVVGDEAKLRQVLINLLGNAVKFTDIGGASLRVSRQGDLTRFEVEDTGQGIAEAEQPKLFSAFVQTHSGQRSKEGTGLGLAISRQIVNLMGGDIDLRSAVGQGSVFSFAIGLPATDEALALAERRVIGLAPGQVAPRILVVDDTEENRLLLKQLLSSVGFEVREAANGQEAVECVETWRPALIFMDVRMPVMDGLTATRRIRAFEAHSGAPRAAILALTAGAFEHEREEMLREGADDFVAKPFRVAAIFERIGLHIPVTYAYADEGEGVASDVSVDGASTLSAERLRSLSEAHRRELHEALAAGHVRRAHAAVEKIRLDDEPLGAALLVEVQAFRFDELLTLLERTERPR